MSWRKLRVAEDRTHHLRPDASPAYAARFDEVLAFHEPGIAAVAKAQQAWHIWADGSPSYAHRFQRTFGYYEGLAAVVDEQGWYHVAPSGEAAHAGRYSWCGNFQGGRCTVRYGDGMYGHITGSGEPAYTKRWKYAGDYRNGIAVVQAADGQSTHIDVRGARIHDQWFADLDVFHKRFARARDDGGWTHVDTTGRPAYERRFAAVEPFYNGQARVEGFDGGLEIIDECGSTVQILRAASETDLQRLSGLMVGFWRTQVLRTAADLRVIDHLPGAVEDVAMRTALPVDATRRLLRALWEIGLVNRRERMWVPTTMGNLLRSDSPSGMAQAAQHWGTEHYAAWAELGASLASGKPGFERLYGQPVFSWLADKPNQLARYHRAMRGYAMHDYDCLHEYLSLDGVEHVIDAGGGSGVLVATLIAKRPDISATVLDRPEVIASPSVSSPGAEGIRWLGADLFAPWPCTADLVVLARVVHDWDDDRARTILRNARSALEPGGRIAVVEFVLCDDNPKGALLDLNMLAICGARERNAAAWESLARSANLKLTDIVALPRYGSLITLRPVCAANA